MYLPYLRTAVILYNHLPRQRGSDSLTKHLETHYHYHYYCNSARDTKLSGRPEPRSIPYDGLAVANKKLRLALAWLHFQAGE